MKKIFFAMVAVCAMLFSACSNDEIEITSTGKTHELTVNVNTQNVYDTFGITDVIKSVVRDGDIRIGVISFLYDSNGDFVDWQTNTLTTFNTIPVSFPNLAEGVYTLVTIETVVTGKSNKSPCWNFEKDDKLSTFAIVQKVNEVSPLFALGVDTRTINHNGSLGDVAVSPNAIGSIVNLWYHNFDKSTHVNVGFTTDDIISEYRLNPTLDRNDRFFTARTDSKHIRVRNKKDINGSTLFSTCYLLEKSIDYSFRFVKKENEGKELWTGYNSNSGSAQLEDGKTYYGGFYYTDANSAPSCYFGDLVGYTNWYDEVKTGNFIPDLYMTWKGSVSAVQSFMNGYDMIKGLNGKAELSGDDVYEIQYSGKGKEGLISYSFTSATTGLFEADAYYLNKDISKADALSYLKKNYVFLTNENDVYMYKTLDNKTIVVYYPISDEISVVGFVDMEYLDNTSNAVQTLPKQFVEKAKRFCATRSIVR